MPEILEGGPRRAQRPHRHSVLEEGGEHLLIPLLEWLSMPWEAVRVAAVCRTWNDSIVGHGSFWSTLSLHGEQLPGLAQLLRRCGPRLRKLDLSGIGVKGGSMPGLQEGLEACVNLEDLNLAGCRGVEALPAGLSRTLRRLNIAGCGALHGQLKSLIGEPLRHLHAGWLSESCQEDLFGLWIQSPLFFQNLCNRYQCPNLMTLRVPGFELRQRRLVSKFGEDLVRLQYEHILWVATFGNLRRLDLPCCGLLQDDVLSQIVVACSKLRSLNVRACELLTDKSMLAVAQSMGPRLVHLNVSCCRFSDPAMRGVVAACSHLKTLDLCYCPALSADFVAYLCGDPSLCPGLRMLGAGGLNLGDAELEAICAKYPNLVHLGMGSATRVTDAGLRSLARLPGLRKLSAHRLERVSVQGIIELCERSPSLRAVDAEEYEGWRSAPYAEITRFEKCLEERKYDYDESDGETEPEDEQEHHEPLSGWAALHQLPAA